MKFYLIAPDGSRHDMDATVKTEALVECGILMATLDQDGRYRVLVPQAGFREDDLFASIMFTSKDGAEMDHVQFKGGADAIDPR